jgi:hypothetical protein
MIGFQNCTPMESQFNQTGKQSTGETPPEMRVAKNDCRFIGGPALSSVLRDVLGLESGDTAMLNDNLAPLVSQNCKSFNQQANGRQCFYIAEYASELATTQCNASTFRLVSQIYMNACAESLSESTNVARLFPQGSGMVNAIHLAFTGREIRADEAQILRDLASQFESEQEKMTAICSALGSSLAAINSF